MCFKDWFLTRSLLVACRSGADRVQKVATTVRALNSKSHNMKGPEV